MNNREFSRPLHPVYCVQCGSKLVENASYCSMCGAFVRGATEQIKMDISNCIKTLSMKEQISGIVWIVVGIFQMIIGYFDSFAFFLLGASNIRTGIARLRQSQKVQTPYIGMIEEYRKRWKSLLVSMIFNLLIGGVVGFTCMIATLCEINTRSYALKNKEFLELKTPHSAR